jgi:hypothetical protein
LDDFEKGAQLLRRRSYCKDCTSSDKKAKRQLKKEEKENEGDTVEKKQRMGEVEQKEERGVTEVADTL